MVAPQLSQGGRPPFGGTAQAGSTVGFTVCVTVGVTVWVTRPTVRSGTDAVAEHAAHVGQSA